MLRKSKSILSSLTLSQPKVKRSVTENDLAQFRNMNLDNTRINAIRNQNTSLSQAFETLPSYFPYIASPTLFQKKSPLSLSHVSEEAAIGSPTPPSVPRMILQSTLKRDRPLTQNDFMEFQKLLKEEPKKKHTENTAKLFTHQKPKHEHECVFTFNVKGQPR